MVQAVGQRARYADDGLLYMSRNLIEAQGQEDAWMFRQCLLSLH